MHADGLPKRGVRAEEQFPQLSQPTPRLLDGHECGVLNFAGPFIGGKVQLETVSRRPFVNRHLDGVRRALADDAHHRFAVTLVRGRQNDGRADAEAIPGQLLCSTALDEVQQIEASNCDPVIVDDQVDQRLAACLDIARRRSLTSLGQSLHLRQRFHLQPSGEPREMFARLLRIFIAGFGCHADFPSWGLEFLGRV